MQHGLELVRALAKLPPAEQERVLGSLMRRRKLLRFVQDSTPGYKAGWVHVDICARLERFSQAVAEGRSPRLMLFMPPRHGKSQIVSRRFPVWHLGHHPDHEVILATYGQDLSNDLSRDALACCKDKIASEAFPELRVSPKRDATEQWRTTVGGGLAAAGVGGPVTGRGAHVLLVDDPVKGAKEAASAVYRQDQKHWYQQNARTRLAPGGGVLLTMTRWHDDDLAGWLIEQAKQDGEQWEIVLYPAIAEVDEPHRQAGEALHSDRYPLDALRAIERAVGPYAWASLYQQRPVPAQGHVIAPAWLEHTYPWKSAPAGGRTILSIDCANKASELADYSVVLVARYVAGKVYLLDLWRGQVSFPDLEQKVADLAGRWTPHTILIENEGNGQALIPNIRRRPGWRWPIVPVEPLAKKEIRMSNESGWLAAGDVVLPDASGWVAELKRELLAFPKGAHDDQVDALSQLLAWLRDSSGAAGLFRFG